MRQRRRSKLDATRLGPWLSQRSALFRQLSSEATEALLQRGRIRRFARDTVLAQQGQESLTFYVVVDGIVSARVMFEGVQREVFSYESGELAGGLTLLRQGEWPYSLIASREVEVVEFDARAISKFVAALRPLATEFLRVVAGELAEHSRVLDQNMLRLSSQAQARTVGSGGTFRRDDR